MVSLHVSVVDDGKRISTFLKDHVGRIMLGLFLFINQVFIFKRKGFHTWYVPISITENATSLSI